MPERIKITIRASSAHPDVLTVQDAMRQVLDIFDTIDREPGVEWRLLRAATNTPLFVEGEAISLEPSVDVSVVARMQKQAFAKNWRDIANGKIPDDPEFNVRAARRVLARNINGVGATEIDFEMGEPVTVTPTIARQVSVAFDENPNVLFEPVPAREEVGSIEGTLQGVSTYYGFPAVRILESRTRDFLWCRLSDELQSVFQNKAPYFDVWHHQRVMMRGRIKYNAKSEILSVFATDIRRIDPPAVSLQDIKDANFTGGLSIPEYLDRFREGMLG